MDEIETGSLPCFTAVPSVRHTLAIVPSNGTFVKYNKEEARQRLGLPQDKKLILFASQRVTTPNKGMDYLIEACRLLGDHTKGQTPYEVVILGGHAEELVDLLQLKAHPLGYVNDERRIVDVYNAVDVFVLPSLSEN